MPKSSTQNAVLVKKHNKTDGKKWILNMDFLRIWETGAYKNKFFWREKEGFNNHITHWYSSTSTYILYTKTLAIKKTKSGHLVKVIFGQNEIGIGQNGLYYNINIYLYYNIGWPSAPENDFDRTWPWPNDRFSKILSHKPSFSSNSIKMQQLISKI